MSSSLLQRPPSSPQECFPCSNALPTTTLLLFLLFPPSSSRTSEPQLSPLRLSRSFGFLPTLLCSSAPPPLLLFQFLLSLLRRRRRRPTSKLPTRCNPSSICSASLPSSTGIVGRRSSGQERGRRPAVHQPFLQRFILFSFFLLLLSIILNLGVKLGNNKICSSSPSFESSAHVPPSAGNNPNSELIQTLSLPAHGSPILVQR